jgi:hypothetical protein
MTADTTSFQAGIAKSVTTLRSAEREVKRLDKALQEGRATPEQFAAAMQKVNRDVTAINAGFRGMTGAVKRADDILRSLETTEERQANQLRELQQLLQVGAINYDQYSLAVGRMTNAQISLGTEHLANLPVIGRFSGLMQSAVTPVGLLTAGLMGAAGAAGLFYAAFRKGGDIVLPALERLEEVGLSAQRIGISMAGLQRFQYAFETIANIDAETTVSALEKMEKNISAAAVGSKKAVATFQQLGLNIDEIKKLSPEQSFLKIAQALSQVQSPFDQLRLTTEVFGKSATSMINVIQGGAEPIQALGERAEQLRLTLSEIDSVQALAAQDAIDDLRKAFEGLGNVLTSYVAPPLTEVVKDLTSLLTLGKTNTGFGFADIGKAIVAGGGNPWATAYELSQRYFNGVTEGAIKSSNEMLKAGEKQRKAMLTPEDIAERQEQMEAFKKDQDKRRKVMETDAKKQFALRKRHEQELLKKQTEAAKKQLEFQNAAAQLIREERGKRSEMYVQSLQDGMKKATTQSEVAIFGRQIQQELVRQTGINITSLQQQLNRTRDPKDRAELIGRIRKERLGLSEALVNNLRMQMNESKGLIGSSLVKGPAALERGSAAAFSAFQANKRQDDIANLQLAEQRKANQHLAELKRRGVVLAEARL